MSCGGGHLEWLQAHRAALRLSGDTRPVNAAFSLSQPTDKHEKFHGEA